MMRYNGGLLGGRCAMRGLTAAELLVIEVLARSRTASGRQVERAQIIKRATGGETPRAIAAALRIDAETVRRRIRRFDTKGLASLEDHPRSGRPATYSADDIAALIAVARTSPCSLGLPFASWTLD